MFRKGRQRIFLCLWWQQLSVSPKKETAVIIRVTRRSYHTVVTITRWSLMLETTLVKSFFSWTRGFTFIRDCIWRFLKRDVVTQCHVKYRVSIEPLRKVTNAVALVTLDSRKRHSRNIALALPIGDLLFCYSLLYSAKWACFYGITVRHVNFTQIFNDFRRTVRWHDYVHE